MVEFKPWKKAFWYAGPAGHERFVLYAPFLAAGELALVGAAAIGLWNVGKRTFGGDDVIEVRTPPTGFFSDPGHYRIRDIEIKDEVRYGTKGVEASPYIFLAGENSDGNRRKAKIVTSEEGVDGLFKLRKTETEKLQPALKTDKGYARPTQDGGWAVGRDREGW